MKVILDSSLCSGHGRCYALSPETFAADEAGFGVVNDLPEQPTEEQRQAAEAAARNCPEFAIKVE